MARHTLQHSLLLLLPLSVVRSNSLFSHAVRSLMILIFALHLPRARKRTRGGHPSNAAAHALGPLVAEQSAPDARAVTCTGLPDALLRIVAVPLGGQDARGGVYARTLGSGLAASVHARRVRTACDALGGRAEDAQWQRLAAAAEEGRGRQGADGGVGVEGAAAAAFGRGCEGQDRGVVCQQVVGCGGGVGGRMARVVDGSWGEMSWDGGGGCAGRERLIEVDDLRVGEVWLMSRCLLLAGRGWVCVAILRHGLDGGQRCGQRAH